MKKLDWTTIFISAFIGVLITEIWHEIKKRDVAVRAPAGN